jgi:pimeloyl-ACP methyl ester carboxylesterase
MEIPITSHGKGEPLIWLHGMLNSVESDSVYSLVDLHLLAKLVQLIRYNVGGKSVSGDYSWDAAATELIGIANRMKLSTFIAGGCSMGSGTAIHAAVRFPERIKALLLIMPPPAWENRQAVTSIYTKIASKLKGAVLPEFLQRLITRQIDPPDFYEQLHPGTRKEMLRFRLTFDSAYYQQIYCGGAASDFPERSKIAELNIPTLIVALDNDINHPLDIALELHSLIKTSELIVVKTYHDYQLLQERVARFIDKLNGVNKLE